MNLSDPDFSPKVNPGIHIFIVLLFILGFTFFESQDSLGFKDSHYLNPDIEKILDSRFFSKSEGIHKM